jgi:hypothetical protein
MESQKAMPQPISGPLNIGGEVSNMILTQTIEVARRRADLDIVVRHCHYDPVFILRWQGITR